MMPIENLTGQQFGLLTAVKLSDNPPRKNAWRLWECKCECGNTSIVASGNLKSGHTRSCGCLKKGKRYESN